MKFISRLFSSELDTGPEPTWTWTWTPAANRCPKCGAGKSTVRYHSAGRYCSAGGYRNSHEADEHLHYRCETCFYDWTTPTRDSA